MKSLKKQEKQAGTNFVLLFQYINMIGRFMKRICIQQSSLYIFLQCFSFSNNTPPESWVAYITRGFLTWYSCLYHSSMVVTVTLYLNFHVASFYANVLLFFYCFWVFFISFCMFTCFSFFERGSGMPPLTLKYFHFVLLFIVIAFIAFQVLFLVI